MLLTFYCHQVKLVIELDGSVHNDAQVAILDTEREKDLIAWGCQVIRFKNIQVLNSIESVLDKIRSYLK